MRSNSSFARAAWCGALAAMAGMCGWAAPAAEAASARRLGQAISAYSASLFGKTGLSAFQQQTLACDPDEPLGGSTSVLYNPSVVQVTGFGFGPGYLVADNSPFASGVGIE